jgi:NADH:ubiquinone oxidoreductase subunit F (NADH-binding)
MDLLTAPPPRMPWPARVDPQQLLMLLRAAGLRGRGGASFPTATKIASALGRRPLLVVNACDGEPLVAKDEVLLRRSPGLVADGAALVAQAVGAREVVLAAHQGSAAESHLRQLLAVERFRWPAARLLAVPRRYVASEASALASAALGGPALPAYHERPMSTGGTAGGDAVLVLNAETLAQVALLWAGHRAPLSRLVTLSGALAASGVLEVAPATTVADLVDLAGGPTEAPRAVLVGGYGGGWLDWTTAAPLTLDQLDHAVGLGAGLLHVLGSGACPVEEVAAITDYLASQSAGQCGPCMFGLPALALDWRELSQAPTADAAWRRLQRRLPLVEGRGACRHPDGAVRQLATAVQTFGDHLQQHRAGHCDAVARTLVGVAP